MNDLILKEVEFANEFSRRFADWRVLQTHIDYRKAFNHILHLLHSMRNTLTTIIDLNIGFHQHTHQIGDHSAFKNSNVYLIEEKLFFKSKDQIQEVGKARHVLLSSQPHIYDNISDAGQICKNLIGTLIIGALLDAARDHLNSVLRDFSLRTNDSRSMSIQRWHEEVNKTAKYAGLLWAAIKLTDNDDLIGSEDTIGIIQSLASKTTLSTRYNEFEIYHLNISFNKPISVVKAVLPVTKTQIWFGIERKDFGYELEAPTPWRNFLERFIIIADTALHRYTMSIEISQLRSEASRARKSVIMDLALHDFINCIRGLINTCCTLNDQLKHEPSTPDEIKTVGKRLYKSAEALNSKLGQMLDMRKSSELKPCILNDVLQRTEQLFKGQLAYRNITLNIKTDRIVSVDVPYDLVYLTFNELIVNARDAITNTGIITIETLHEPGNIICYVSDSGIGIPENKKQSIFDSGYSSKGKNRGIGLPTLRRSLNEHKSSIELIDSSKNKTMFKITFPASVR